jgi:hypothetical protein
MRWYQFLSLEDVSWIIIIIIIDNLFATYFYICDFMVLYFIEQVEKWYQS